MSLDELNGLPPDGAANELSKCCGSPAWVNKMVSARPFSNEEAMFKQGQQAWFGGSRSEWIAAFNQYAESGASRERAAQLEKLEKEYEARFGYAFVLHAVGISPDEVIAILKSRLRNNPYDEIKIATAEQNKIIRLGLKSMLS